MKRTTKTVILPLIVLGLGALGFLPDSAVDALNQILQQSGQSEIAHTQSAQTPTKPKTTQPKASQSNQTSNTNNADFDFYVLALSWSPTYCADQATGRNAEQCGPNKDFGFIVHGLWPQNEDGYPEYCGTKSVDRVSRDIEQGILDIIPSRGLVRHQWVKHGTCSGLSPGGYFGKTRKAYKSVSIPSELRPIPKSRRIDAFEIENAFIDANPSLEKDAIAVQCNKNRVKEVRICLSKDLKPRSCEKVDRSGCTKRDLEMPAPK